MQILKFGDKADIQHLYKLDKRLKSIADIRIEERDIYPINLEEEQEIFVENVKKGIKYNPQFKYNSIDYTKTDVLKKIDLLSNDFIKFDHELSRFYLSILDFYRKWVNVFTKDEERSSQSFADSLFQLYGKADYRGFELANDILKFKKRIDVPSSERIHDFDYLKSEFVRKMVELGIDPWECVPKSMTGRVNVSPSERLIYISKTAKFSEGDVNSLLAHEIGTHVYRAEKGYELGLNGFVIGTPEGIETEEGMAIRNSIDLKITKPNILFEVSLLMLLASKVDTMSFHDLFEFLEPYNSDVVWRFKRVCRVKRCLEDTSVFGGFTKDQIYLKGYSIVKNLDQKTFETLFKYKLSYRELNHIPYLDLIMKNKKYLDV